TAGRGTINGRVASERRRVHIPDVLQDPEFKSVQENAASSVQATFFDNGERKFKYIARPIRVWSWPKRLSSLRAEGKPRVFLAPFEGQGGSEERFAKGLDHELKACLSRLSGLELTANRAKAHYLLEGAVHTGEDRYRIF